MSEVENLKRQNNALMESCKILNKALAVSVERADMWRGYFRSSSNRFINAIKLYPEIDWDKVDKERPPYE